MNYDFGPKRHWRRWVWNRIAERVAEPRSALIFYLPGGDDFDREIAMSKGFLSRNMIAFEREQRTLASLRSRGILTVNADIVDGIHAASERRSIDVVHLDFCGGLKHDLIADIGRWFFSPYLLHTVFAINLLRGRDSSSNELRRVFHEDCPAFAGSWAGLLGNKHRAFNLALGLMYHTALQAVNPTHDPIEMGSPEEDVLVQRVNAAAEGIFRTMKCSFNTYRSTTNQTFDSVVFKNPMSVMNPSTALWAKQLKFYRVNREHLQKRRPFITNAGRSVAAVLAHRTMRAPS